MRNTQVLRLCWCAHVFLHKDELSVPASKNGDMIPFSDYMFSVTSVYDTISAIKRTSMLDLSRSDTHAPSAQEKLDTRRLKLSFPTTSHRIEISLRARNGHGRLDRSIEECGPNVSKTARDHLKDFDARC